MSTLKMDAADCFESSLNMFQITEIACYITLISHPLRVIYTPIIKDNHFYISVMSHVIPGYVTLAFHESFVHSKIMFFGRVTQNHHIEKNETA
jgi:hypothetical protein